MSGAVLATVVWVFGAGPISAQNSGTIEQGERQTAVRQGGPAAVSIRFFGVSTLLVDDGRTRLLVDGYFSRPGLAETLFSRLSSDAGAIEAALGGSGPEVTALLVAHAHHDHVLDMPAIMARSEATVVIGTEAVRRMGLAQGLTEDRLFVGADTMLMAFGDFEVEPIMVPHGPPLPVLGAWLDREMTHPPVEPTHFTQYRDRDNLSFLIRRGGSSILVHPSAGERDLTALGADVVFLGMGRVGAQQERRASRYFEHILGPRVRLVVPVHWDAFTTGPGQPLRPTPWPFDRVGEGMRRLCAFVAERKTLQVSLPTSGSVLALDEEGRVSLEGQWTDPCRDNNHH